MASITNKQAWLSALSDVLINLSAAWFGLILIAPPLLSLDLAQGVITVIANAGFGSVALLAAVKIRRMNS